MKTLTIDGREYKVKKAVFKLIEDLFDDVDELEEKNSELELEAMLNDAVLDATNAMVEGLLLELVKDDPEKKANLEKALKELHEDCEE